MTELKDRILNEAEALFCQYGVKSITMDDIARHLGISKKTIYLHFEDKNELVKLQMKNMMDQNQCVMNINCQSSDNCIHEVFLAVTHIRVLLSKMNPALFYDLQKYHPSAWQEFKNFRDKYLVECIKENLRRGIADGYYRKEINVDILSRMRVQQIDAIFNPKAFPADKFNLVEVIEVITEHFLYGITTPKGQELINKYKSINEEE
jgi:AcrR family transcriptional regulator